MQASMKLGEAMYKASAAAGEAAGTETADNKSDDVIDAVFKEVIPDDKKKSA
jgi:molecular chaperone DnaK